MNIEQNYDMKIINKFLLEATHHFTIYCDLDGVLCDLPKAFKDLGHGSIEGVIDRGGEGMFFGLIGKAGVEFWSNMPWMEDGKRLWSFIKHYPVKILSAPTRNPTSVKGKNIWIDNQLGKHVERILTSQKQKYANKNSILIDDRPSNIEKWNLAGGIGILHKDAETTIKRLKEILR